MASAIHHIVDKAKSGVSKDRQNPPGQSQQQSQGHSQNGPENGDNTKNLTSTTSNETSNASTSPRRSRAADFFRVKTKDSQADVAQREEEKDFIRSFQEDETIVSPDNLAKDSRTQRLGNSSRRLRVGDFSLLKTLGTGTFARVWLAKFANPTLDDRDKVFALKVLRKADVIKLKQVEHVRNEREVLAAVAGHPFITTLITTFADDTSLYMLLDYTPGGEIFSYLRRARRFPERVSVFYAAEIVLILSYLHDVQNVAYRDLKPENILIDAQGHLKLVDFGFAKKLAPHVRAHTSGNDGIDGESTEDLEGSTADEDICNETYTLCGTPEYLAPEVIRNTGHGKAVDWWALGILIYEFMVGQPPFWDSNPMRIYEQIVAGRIKFPNPASSGLEMSDAAKDVILGLCRTDPTARLGHIAGGSQRVRDHPFFREVDWEELYYKRGCGPIVPKLKGKDDCGNFDEYPDPDEHEGRASRYTRDMRKQYESAFADF